jgi:hypothetical protein
MCFFLFSLKFTSDILTKRIGRKLPTALEVFSLDSHSIVSSENTSHGMTIYNGTKQLAMHPMEVLWDALKN